MRTRFWAHCRRVAKLTAVERKLTVEAALLLIAALLLRRFFSTGSLLWLPLSQLPPVAQDGDRALALRIAGLHRAARILNIRNCLVRAIAMRLMLRRAGIAGTLHIGVRKTESGRLAAHAWISVENRVILGGEGLINNYTELLGLRAPRSTVTL